MEIKTDNLENRIENYFSSESEQYEKTDNNFRENFSLVSENKSKLEFLENKLDNLDKKLEEILKKSDNNKKSFNIFKR